MAKQIKMVQNRIDFLEMTYSRLFDQSGKELICYDLEKKILDCYRLLENLRKGA